MAGFNPFAPQAMAPSKAPQLQGIAAPNVGMQKDPSLMQSLGPTIAQRAMGSETSGQMVDLAKDKIGNAWSALTNPTATAPAVVPAAAPTVASTVSPAIAPVAQGLGVMGGTAASGAGAGLAAAAAPAASTLGVVGGTAASGAGAGLASAAPAAAALGPLGIPILIGAGLYAASEGK